MKISELIATLQYEMETHGDIDVKFDYDSSDVERAYEHDGTLYLDK